MPAGQPRRPHPGIPRQGGTRRRTVVTKQVLRQWIDKHEEGKSLAQIANHFKVDRRTVEKHVPAAIEKRRWQRLRDEIDSEELKNHLGRIRGAARILRDHLQLPQYGAYQAWAWPEDPDGLPMEEILLEHFPSLPAWDLLVDWQTRFASYIASCERLEARVAQEVETRGWLSEAARGIFDQALAGARGSQPPDTTAYSEMGKVPWQAAMEEISVSEDYRAVEQEWGHLNAIRAQLHPALTEIAFRVRVPGECRFCIA